MAIRGIRGAITVQQDTPEEIRQATRRLLKALVDANPSLASDDIASAFFTVSQDLVSEYPAHGARELGWTQVPLMCACEIPVTTGMPRCIRVLVHWNTELPQSEIQHVYLEEARKLRPDLGVNKSETGESGAEEPRRKVL
jgi:chorismate mutase